MSRIWAVVPAAGSGSRMAGVAPKQYLQVHGRTLLDWSVAALLRSPELAGCVVAVPPADVDAPLSGSLRDERVTVCAGGATRAESVAAGLEALPAADNEWVLVHDAARPCLPFADLERLIARVTESGVGAILARPVTDTLKRSDANGRVTGTLDRANIWGAQTPQLFRRGELLTALVDAKTHAVAVTDEASAMERLGHEIQLVEGSAVNFKVTYPEDLQRAAQWLAQFADTQPSSAAVKL